MFRAPRAAPRAPRLTGASVTERTRRSVTCLIALILALGMPLSSWAVVCPFSTYLPIGQYGVGHASQWSSGTAESGPGLVQWWYPADPVKDSVAASYVYSDYLFEAMQSRPLERDEPDPEQGERMKAFVKGMKDRGLPWILFDHLMAATMLATRESTPLAKNWPVIWLDGDPSFGDELASHGFIVVSSPPLAASTPTQDKRVQMARQALEATRSKFQVSLRQLGFIGFRENAPLAARLSGMYPQSAGLALVGNWTALDPQRKRKETRWLDPSEITTPTLHIVAGETSPVKLQSHPLQSPFSATTRVYFSDIDDAHLEFGLPESCVTQYVVGRKVPPLVQVLAQRELRAKLASFFAVAFDVPIHLAPLRLLPFDEKRRVPLNMIEEQLPAIHTPPPRPAQIAELLQAGGVAALLQSLPVVIHPLLPASWWDNAIAQIHSTGKLEQVSVLLDAWQVSQPNSLAAAVHRAAHAQSSGADAAKLWKQARRLVKSDQRLSAARRAELAVAIDTALKSKR